MSAVRVAAIDVGTNTVLMLVARAHAGRLERIADYARIARLGQGIDASGTLAPEAIERTLAVLREYRALATSHGAHVVAVGTSALRDAGDAARFLEPAAAVLGAPVEVISGLREAALTFRGGLEGLTLDDRAIVLVDIGGGSTEIVTGTRAQLTASASLDIGSVRLFERCSDGDPPSPRAIAAMRAAVDRALAQGAPPLPPDAQLVAIAGTATTIAAIALGIDDADPARVRGATISLDQTREIADRLATMTTAERRAIAGMDPGRADVIVAGALLLVRIAEHTGAPHLTISDGGVRVGLALEAGTELRN